MKTPRLSLVLTALTLAATLAHGVEKPVDPLWQPVTDTVYLQEIGQTVATDSPLTHAAVHGDALYTVMNGALFTLDGDDLVAASGAPGGVTHLEALNGALWVAASGGIHRLENGAWAHLSDLNAVDFCLHLGVVHAATRDRIYRYDDGTFVDIEPEGGWLTLNTTYIMEDGTQVLRHPIRLGPIQHIESYGETIHLWRPQGLGKLEGSFFNTYAVDWGDFPSDTIRDMMSYGSRIYFSTDRGLTEYRGMSLTTLRGSDGLPSIDTTCLAKGFDGDLWVGTTTGAARRTADNDWHYFGAHHWLPGDGVNAIATGDQVVYIATNAGLGVIRYEPFTLAKKAAYYERQLEEWGHKRMGFIHKLWWSNEHDAWIREISDNDGGHTSHYLAAMSFKYAVTGDPEDRAEAVNTFTAMVWLEQITGTDGFFARAIWNDEGDLGQRAEGGSGGLPAKWYETEDGEWWWKGDTSSDEVNAHYYAVSIFHDLVAEGDEKLRAQQHLARISDHIIDNGWILRDNDGEPTRWGRWDPDYLLRPYGISARGLNGMEAQGYMWTAIGLTGEQRFKDGLAQLIEWDYHRYTLRQKHAFPRQYIVPWDNELAFRTYHPLLRYADDPYLRGIYMRSLERHWEIMRMQKVPTYNFMYGGLTGNDCEVDVAVQHLREWMLTTINHDFRNIHRDDLLEPEPGYTPLATGTRGLSPRETTAMWGSRSAIEMNGGSGGRGVTPAIGWLEDYWMGRYYGMITEPDTEEPSLTTVSGPSGETGAAPYTGPARPEGILALVE